MKILLLITIVVCFGYIGYGFSRYYFKRVKFFNDCVVLCEKLVIEINFTKTRLAEIIESILSNFSKEMKNCLCFYLNYLNKKNEDFENLVNHEMSNLLSSDENSTFVLFLKSLGRLDSCNQIKEIENYKLKFEKYKKDAEQNNKTFGGLFIKLGIILGLLLAILLV